MFQRKRLDLQSIFIHLMVIAILLDSASMYTYVTISPVYKMGYGWIIGFLCLVGVLLAKRIIIDGIAILRLFILCLAFIIYAVVTRYNLGRFFVGYVGPFVLFFIFSYVLFRSNRIVEFFEAYSRIVIIIAIISLFCWSFGSILRVLPGRREITYYWADQYRVSYTYYFLYFENPTQNIVHGTICNLGIFTESPGYSGVLTYGLLIELVLLRNSTGNKKKNTVLKIIIYVVTLISTNSSKGIICVMIALFIDFVSLKTKSKILSLLKWFVGCLALIVVIVGSLYVIEAKMMTSSGNVRFDDLTAGLKAWFSHPFFGNGFGNADSIRKYWEVNRSNDGLSMGLTVLLAYGGLYFFVIYFGAALVCLRIPYFNNHKKSWYLICAVFAFNLFISNSGFTNPYIFITAAAYAAPRKETPYRLRASIYAAES